MKKIYNKSTDVNVAATIYYGRYEDESLVLYEDEDFTQKVPKEKYFDIFCKESIIEYEGYYYNPSGFDPLTKAIFIPLYGN